MMRPLPEKDVVLLGIGHTNAHVLRMWRMRPIPGARLTCVSNQAVSAYSGMLPGVLAGQYPPERMEIDLVRLCAAAGARLVIGDVTGMDADRRELRFADRPPMRFDALSIGIGSVPAGEHVRFANDARLLPIKPMQTFLDRLDERLRESVAERRGAPIRIAVVGGGAGGVEVTCCLPAHLRTRLGGDVRFEITIVTADDRLVPGSLGRTARRVERLLRGRGVRIVTGRRVERVDGHTIAFQDRGIVDADVIVWVTGAAAPPLLARLGLPTDAAGFLLTSDTLQTTSGAPVFAVGDTGTIAGSSHPKAGVYAVRQAPIVWDNLQRMLSGAPLRRYRPQGDYLKLLNTGDGRALGEWKGLSFEGRWPWALKDFIDSRFIAKYQDYAPAAMSQDRVRETPVARMRCAGCGGKVGAGVLSRVLRRLDVPASEHVLVGLEAAADAAVVVAPEGRPVVATVDAFAAPLDDPYIAGRIGALNAASDVFALGAAPWAALATVAIPPGAPHQQEDLLFQVLSGGLDELRGMGATLIGGHTIEGAQLTVGFTVLGTGSRHPLRTQGGLRAGDRLILTKALGTGVLLAAHMQARCRARWFGPLVASMLASNGPAAACLERYDVSGLTDVTGFGLAGHLLGMLRASGLAADLWLAAVPLLPGAGELLRDGLESTLADSNREVQAEIDPDGDSIENAPSFRALFDPQTGGGLLLGVSSADAEGVLDHLRSVGFRQASIIGEVEPASAARRRIRVGYAPPAKTETAEARTGDVDQRPAN
jgi:selenide,water dikinase